MKTGKVKKQGRWLDSRTFVLVLALVISLVSWIIVAGWIRPSDTTTLTGVSINYATLSANYRNQDLAIVGDRPTTAGVRVSGDGGVLVDLTSADVSVYCDYSGVTGPGEYTITLKAQKETGGNFEILSVAPETITLQFEKVSTSVFSLSVQADDVTAAAGYYKGEATPDTQLVEVSGPEGEMEQIAGAAVIITEDVERSSTYTAPDAQVVLLDANGEVVETSELVSISPAVVTVDIPIVPTKELPLTLNIVGAPQGFDKEWFEGLVTLSVDNIRVAGEASLLEQYTEIAVGSIDVSEFTVGKQYVPYTIALPDGLYNLDSLQQVTATVDTSGLAEQTFEIPISQLQVVSPPEGLTVEPTMMVDNTRSVEVTLVGPEELLSGLLAEDISVEVVASSITADGGMQQEAPLRIYVPRSGRLFAIGSPTILCDVEANDASGA